jgi:hypothetical protein
MSILACPLLLSLHFLLNLQQARANNIRWGFSVAHYPKLVLVQAALLEFLSATARAWVISSGHGASLVRMPKAIITREQSTGGPGLRAKTKSGAPYVGSTCGLLACSFFFSFLRGVNTRRRPAHARQIPTPLSLHAPGDTLRVLEGVVVCPTIPRRAWRKG